MERDVPSPQRVLLGWLGGTATVAAMVLGAWTAAHAWRPRLPDPVAVHWGVGGDPDGYASLAGVTAVCTWLGVLGLAALVVVGVLTRRRPAYLRGWMAGLTPFVALAPASLLLVLLPNLDARTAEQAGPVGPELLLVIVLPAVAGALAWTMAAAPGRRWAAAPAIRPGAEVDAERAPYRERVVMVNLWGITLAVILLDGLLALVAGGWVLAFGLVLVVALLWFGIYRYDVGDEGVRVSFGPLGPVARRVPVEEIEGADVIDVRPRSWGGWGYRISGSHSAVVMRRGPGAQLGLAGGRSLTLSTVDADRLAGRVNGAVVRHWEGR